MVNRLAPGQGQIDPTYGLKAKMHVNVAAVAIANKIARIAWAVLTTGERYRSTALQSA